MKSTLDIIANGAADQGLDLLLIGGRALPAFGVNRQTMDVDCLIAGSELDNLKELLSNDGYEEIVRTVNFARFSSPSIYHYDIDVILVDVETLKKMLDKSVDFDTGHFVFRVPCAEHMIMLKLHALKNDPNREFKDIGDIVEILRNTPSIDKGDSLKEICEKYGPEGIYDKMKGVI